MEGGRWKSNTKTIRDLIVWATEQFQKNSTQSPRSEVEQILMHLLKCRRIDLYLSSGLDERLDHQAFEHLVHERAKGIPLQYLLGTAYFWCWEFRVRPGVFIPRPETEILVDQAIRCFETRANGNSQLLHLADLGTGSGNIAITLTKVLTHCKISAIEISAAALEVARENAALHGVEERIHFRQENWSAFLKRDGGVNLDRMDGIIANPPYIPSGEIGKLDLEVRQEPREALEGGPEGLDWIDQMLRGAGSLLVDQGYLILEIGDGQAKQVARIARENGWNSFGFVRDLRGIERVFWGQKEK